jgi:hypothetical protein
MIEWSCHELWEQTPRIILYLCCSTLLYLCTWNIFVSWILPCGILVTYHGTVHIHLSRPFLSVQYGPFKLAMGGGWKEATASIFQSLCNTTARATASICSWIWGQFSWLWPRLMSKAWHRCLIQNLEVTYVRSRRFWRIGYVKLVIGQWETAQAQCTDN